MAFGGLWGSRRLGLVLAVAVLVALGAWGAVSERGGRGTGPASELSLTENPPSPAPPAPWPRPASAVGPGGEVAEATRAQPSSCAEASPGTGTSPAADSAGATPAGGVPAAGPAPAAGWQALAKDMVRPAGGPVVTAFGWGQSVTFGDWRFHPGLDVRCPRGTPVTAALAGQVAGVTDEAGWGVTVTLSHGCGLVTVYSGLEAVDLAPGGKVAGGVEFGQVGPPGQWECALGPHLHFELRREGEALDPSRFLR